MPLADVSIGGQDLAHGSASSLDMKAVYIITNK